ncbi:protein kinase domain-containing protein [Actinomadura violacea]|uniref:non-specific serine/threonine protein kinase n=1 Tax=Actinomadura violacea TaxID=2819934 RepID=A0ABS3RQ79_9ACTN|nr:protein kinase [Actinomadura violacea]MBO2458796.1 protein kinase [Actinomadura violacea]
MAAEVLGNRYRLDEPVGAGGMGQVWRAYDQTLDRVVAVKVIAGLNAAPEAAARLRREARAAAKLTGPHVAAVHDYGRDDTANRDYIVTEFITGTDLGSRVRDHGPQDPADVARWGVQICDALIEAHEAGVYHRDLKPQNVMLTARGAIKLVDFGIAAYAEAADYTRITASGVVIGTPAYMSPEQVEDRDVDHRSDLYSLGCTLFELLTGRQPFMGKVVTVLLDHVRTPPPAPSSIRAGLPDFWDEVVSVLLAKDPGHRFSSAEDLRWILDDTLAGRPSSTPASWSEPPAQAQTAMPEEPLDSGAKGEPMQQVRVAERDLTGEYFTGSVKWWNNEKGFGFITPDGPGPDVFAHYSNILMNGFRTLTDGQPVRYTVVQGQRGPMAENITPL